MDDIDDIGTSTDEFIKQFRARSEQRRAKLEEKAAAILDNRSIDMSSERDEVSYPPLSPLREETDDGGSSLEETDHQEESSNTEYRRENTSPSQLDYSSDLSLECDDVDTTITKQHADFYRAEPVVCHASPDQPMLNQYGSNNNIVDRKSPRKGSAPKNDFYQPAHQNQLQQLQPHERKLLQQQQPSAPFQEKQAEHKTPSKLANAQASMAINDKRRELQDRIYRLTKCEIPQITKLLTVSDSDPRQKVEPAWSLQVARNEACECELYLLKMSDQKKSDSLGSLTLSGIEFETRSALKEALATDAISLYFFCVASCGYQVQATRIIDSDRIRKQNQKDYIQFPEVLQFTELPPDFAVSLKVYEYVIKPEHRKITERLGISTPKKSRPTVEVRFNLIGEQKLSQSDRESSRKPLKAIQEGSKYIKPMFKYRMDLRVDKSPSKAGMLHVRRLDENGLRPDWSRFWIELCDGKINFWKSKQDAQDFKIQRPELTIELRNVCCESVQKLTPDDDLYRQNSFVIYEIDRRRGGEGDTLFQRIIDDENCKILKHQFAADNKDERDAWCFVLDKSLQCFREWNCQTKTFSVDELRELFSLIIQRRRD